MSRTEEKLRLAHDTIHKMKQDLKTLNEKRDMVVEKKGEIELDLADIIDGHMIQTRETRERTRLKINKMKKAALRNEMFLHFSFGVIVLLVAIIIAMYGFFNAQTSVVVLCWDLELLLALRDCACIYCDEHYINLSTYSASI